MLEEDKAIVTDIAGTTRDLVEGTVRIGGITLNLIDTAGIRESEDKVEQIGIQRSIEAMNRAQLIILVLDASSELNEEDQKLLEMTEGRQRIVVYNKMDRSDADHDLSVSAINGDIGSLVDAIKEKYENELTAAQMDTLNNERQIGLAIQAENSMKEAVNALKAGMELDLVTLDLQKSWTAIREITGRAGREDLLDEIFSRFCLGK
jgi:tRNA modification GTPase